MEKLEQAAWSAEGSARQVLGVVSAWSKLAHEGVALAEFAGFDGEGRCTVLLAGAQDVVLALSTVGLTASDIGAQLVIAHQRADPAVPIIIGRLQPAAPAPGVGALHVKIDGDRVLLEAEQRIELRCGEASLVLTRAGKVLIRGNYVLSRSRGANKIKGAFVDIN